MPFDHGAGVRSPEVAALIVASAVFYVGSMTLMKLWDRFPPTLMAVGIALCVAGAVWFEILALRQARLGMVYVAILGAEAVMIAAVSRFGFGEAFTSRELAGAALIVTGTMLSAS